MITVTIINKFEVKGSDYIAVEVPKYDQYMLTQAHIDLDLLGKNKYDNGYTHIAKLPDEYKGVLKPYGCFPKDFTERMAKEIVDETWSNSHPDYRKGYSPDKAKNVVFFTAIESLSSKLESIGLYTNNPFEKPTEEDLNEHGWKSDFWGWKWVNREKDVRSYFIFKVRNNLK